MAVVPDDLSVVLLQVATNYFKDPSYKPDKKTSDIALRNAALFGRLLPIARAFLRAPNSASAATVLSDNLSNVLLSPNAREKCVSLLTELKHEIQADSSLHHKHFPGLSTVRWRVDITISSSVLSRVLEPNLIMEFVLSDGQRVTFELSVSKFHKLRFTVASLLKEMDLLNNKMASIKL